MVTKKINFTKPYKYLLFLAYDGSRYAGWQIQKKSITIQGYLKNALSTILKNPTSVIGASRTDAKVHAKQQAAHFTSPHKLNPNTFLHLLNSLLPKDIRIYHIQQVPRNFHACFDATSKIYYYDVCTSSYIAPFQRFFTLHFPKPLNLSLLQQALPFFIGKKDFTSFANKDLKNQRKDNIRHLFRLELQKNSHGFRLIFEANGFLYKMVRNIVGTLLEIACSKISLEAIPSLFEHKNRQCAPPPASPQGLTLIKVNYEIIKKMF